MVRQRVYSLSRALARSFCFALSLPVLALFASALAQEQGVRTVEVLLQTGQELEAKHRWHDALAHYDEALRHFPNDPQLQRRRLWAGMHGDLVRRYGESGFRDLVQKLPQEDALALYAEILLKIQSHYVDNPDFRWLVDRGTVAFEIALSNDVFLDRYLPTTSAADINAFRARLRKRLAAVPVRTRLEARDAVAFAARLAAEEMNLPTVPVILEYTCGMVDSLDDYTAYLPPHELKEVYSQIDGNFVGLGVELRNIPKGLLVLRVIPGSPAQRGGIQPGDIIVQVDGQSTAEMDHQNAADLLQGPEGSIVQVTIERTAMPAQTLHVRREHVEVPSVEDARLLDPQQGIAFLRITAFQKTTAKELDAALWKLHDQGMKYLIIDLRGNPGGLLTAAVEVSDRFLEEGVIVSTRGRNKMEDETHRAVKPGTWHVPLALLIDGDSASASEIFAGAIRDYHRGTIVGVRSYGKGSVQGIFSLRTAGSGIRLTTARFYSPLGKPFTKVGVEPDVAVQVVARPVENQIPRITSDDPFIAAALQVARAQTARRVDGNSR